VPDKLSHMNVNATNPSIAAARCIEEMGKAVGGIAAKDFLIRMEPDSHARFKSRVNDSSLDVVCDVFVKAHAERSVYNADNVQGFGEVCAEFLDSKKKAINTDRKKAKRLMEEDLKETELQYLKKQFDV